MRKFGLLAVWIMTAVAAVACPAQSPAWYDETHIAVAKAAGYGKWYNATGADMAKLKAGKIEAHNHFVNNPRGTVVTPEMVLSQAKRYNRVDETGHLYGAIIAAIRDYMGAEHEGKYPDYYLAYCAHYVGDLSVPVHNTVYNDFNRKNHLAIDATVNDEVLQNLDRVKIYSIRIDSERALAWEIARIANISMKLGYRLEDEKRLLTKEEAYMQLSHSASLFRAILDYVGKDKRPSASLTRAHPQMVDFGSGQGRSILATTVPISLCRDYVEDCRKARTPARAERCRLWMDTHSGALISRTGLTVSPRLASAMAWLILPKS